MEDDVGIKREVFSPCMGDGIIEHGSKAPIYLVVFESHETCVDMLHTISKHFFSLISAVKNI